ncbi:hypothetical protein [Vibrio phage J14]|nr:hypothetical protein [Vibrio phage J14]
MRLRLTPELDPDTVDEYTINGNRIRRGDPMSSIIVKRGAGNKGGFAK